MGCFPACGNGELSSPRFYRGEADQVHKVHSLGWRSNASARRRSWHVPSLTIIILMYPELPPGHFFCALPLPVQTGVPVHCNGYFIVTPERLSMWTPEHPGADAKKVMWNRLLCCEVLPRAYLKALRDVRQELSEPSNRWDLFSL